MSRQTRFKWIGAAIISGIIIVYLIRTPIRTFIVQPLFFLGWFFYRVYASLPQVALWVVLILIATALATKNLSVRREPLRKKPMRPDFSQGSVRTWLRWLNLAEHGELYRLRLSRELGMLTLNTLASRERQSIAQVRQRIRNGGMLVPVRAMDLIMSKPGDDEQIGKKSMFGWRKKNGSVNIDLSDIEADLDYLESLLEVKRGESESQD